MKEILDRLDFYSFLGIWGPGAITVTYYLFTLEGVINRLFLFLGITVPGYLQKYLFVLVYTAIAYLIGVILHEFGKIISDHMFKLSPRNCQITADYSNQSRVPEKGIKREYKTAIETNIPQNVYETMAFDKANLELRHNSQSNMKRSESYHAIYAFSRSLFLCFMFHGMIEFFILLGGVSCCRSSIIMILLDMTLGILFGIRMRRYYYSWIKNVFVQYYLVCIKDEKKYCAKTTSKCRTKTMLGKPYEHV